MTEAITTRTKQIGFYFDQSRCTGCFTCTVACRDWHEYDLGEEPAIWRQVRTIENGSYPNVSVSFLSLSCSHCTKPSCLEACPVSAITKREDGVVLVDRNTCLGEDVCGATCKTACPYDIPSFGTGENAKMQKCNFCIDRLAAGKTIGMKSKNGNFNTR